MLFSLSFLSYPPFLGSLTRPSFHHPLSFALLPPSSSPASVFFSHTSNFPIPLSSSLLPFFFHSSFLLSHPSSSPLSLITASSILIPVHLFSRSLLIPLSPSLPSPPYNSFFSLHPLLLYPFSLSFLIPLHSSLLPNPLRVPHSRLFSPQF